MTTPALLGTLRGMMNTQRSDADRTEEFIQQLSVVPVLVLDDLGTEKLSDWSESVLFRIIDSRYTTRRPLLVSSNLTLERLGSERLASRLGDVRRCEVIVNPAPDWRKGGR
jgi:DNA replication protein DnaC